MDEALALLGISVVCHGKTGPAAIIASLLRTYFAGFSRVSIAIPESLQPICSDPMAPPLSGTGGKQRQFKALSWSAWCLGNDRIALCGDGAHSGLNSPRVPPGTRRNGISLARDLEARAREAADVHSRRATKEEIR